LAKGPEAFRTISEAADELGAPQHVLRFWETRFSFIRPMKRAGGRRFYRPQDIVVLRGVQRLLHDQGYTIKGVQRLHREQGLRRIVAAADGSAPTESMADAAELATAAPTADQRQALFTTLDALESAKAELDRLLERR
jgi:DNA-binding transcriptional MerR regulator